MKMVFAFITSVALSACAPYLQDLAIQPCALLVENAPYPQAEPLARAMTELTSSGVPGVAMAVYSPDHGWWTGAAGCAKLEDQTPMSACHLQYLQSISKTYLAVAGLQLYEQGIIKLDAPITTYLAKTHSQNIATAETITVRMLLNHTSGVPEYNFEPALVASLLQHPERILDPHSYLGYLAGKPLDFPPGSYYSYRNTNYLLLALMVDALTGDHARYISEHIFAPLGLSDTYYRHEKNYPEYPTLMNTYWDRYSDGILENVSQMQRNNVASLIGDDGIITTPVDAVKFLRGLMTGQLVSTVTLLDMQVWATDKKGAPRYGLGLAYHEINGQVAIGHTGGGIGAGCELYYYPAKNLYSFIGINLGTVTDSPLHKVAEPARDNIYVELLK